MRARARAPPGPGRPAPLEPSAHRGGPPTRPSQKAFAIACGADAAALSGAPPRKTCTHTLAANAGGELLVAATWEGLSVLSSADLRRAAEDHARWAAPPAGAAAAAQEARHPVLLLLRLLLRVRLRLLGLRLHLRRWRCCRRLCRLTTNMFGTSHPNLLLLPGLARRRCCICLV